MGVMTPWRQAFLASFPLLCVIMRRYNAASELGVE